MREPKPKRWRVGMMIYQGKERKGKKRVPWATARARWWVLLGDGWGDVDDGSIDDGGIRRVAAREQQRAPLALCWRAKATSRPHGVFGNRKPGCALFLGGWGGVEG